VSDGPELSPEDVQEILRLIDESEYDEFELETPRLSIRFSRHAAGPSARPEPAAPPEAGLVDVPAPLVGTVYRAPRPGAPPFVGVGSRVDQGTQLCTIEVMKLMHNVGSPVSGIVAEVCVENGAAVGYGDVLFRIEPDA
jgi:acetyl-CoA carboxylase biotin carboxyl carrier protein